MTCIYFSVIRSVTKLQVAIWYANIKLNQGKLSSVLLVYVSG